MVRRGEREASLVYMEYLDRVREDEEYQRREAGHRDRGAEGGGAE